MTKMKNVFPIPSLNQNVMPAVLTRNLAVYFMINVILDIVIF